MKTESDTPRTNQFLTRPDHAWDAQWIDFAITLERELNRYKAATPLTSVELSEALEKQKTTVMYLQQEVAALRKGNESLRSLWTEARVVVAKARDDISIWLNKMP